MFSLIGLGEKAGSGVDKIREGWRSVRWRDPTLSEQQKPDRVTLTMPMVSLLPESAVEKLRKILGDELKTLNAEEVQALVTADLEGAVSNFRLQSLTDRHPSDLTKLLKNMVGKDLLEKDGHGRGATYRWSERLRIVSNPATPVRTPGATGGAPGASVNFSGATGASGVAGERDIPPRDPALLSIASPARTNKRLPRAEMQNVILGLCQGRELTGREIAELVQRNQDRVLKNYVSRLVEKGLLARKYPDDPSHPQQAYRSVAPYQRELFD